jgi:ribosomal protein L16/L10AE
VAKVSCGSILFETCGFNNNAILSALKTGRLKLPIKTKIIRN